MSYFHKKNAENKTTNIVSKDTSYIELLNVSFQCAFSVNSVYIFYKSYFSIGHNLSFDTELIKIIIKQVRITFF